MRQSDWFKWGAASLDVAPEDAARPASPPPFDPTDAKVVRLIALVASKRHRPKDIRPEHRLREDLGIDSVASLELLWMLTEELHLEVDVEDVPDVKTVEGTIEFAKQSLARQAA